MCSSNFLILSIFFILITIVTSAKSKSSSSWLDLYMSGDCHQGHVSACYHGEDADLKNGKFSRRFRRNDTFGGCEKGQNGIKATNGGNHIRFETPFGSWKVDKNPNMDEIMLGIKNCSVRCGCEGKYHINGCSRLLRDEFANNQLAHGPFLDDYAGFWLLDLAKGKPEIRKSGKCRWNFITPTPACPNRPEWEYVAPAKLSKGSKQEEQLIIRVGFIWINESQSTKDFEEGWEYANSYIRNELPKNMRFEKREFFYASVQQHFNFPNATDKGVRLRMRVWRCAFGNMTTLLQTIVPEEGRKIEIADHLNWTKDFDEVNACTENLESVFSEHKIVRDRNVNPKNGLVNIELESKKPIKLGNMNLTDQFRMAHMFKFGYMPEEFHNLGGMEESANDYARTKEHGRILLNGEHEDLYAEWTIYNMTAYFQTISREWIKKYKISSENDTGDNEFWIWKGCHVPNYCKVNNEEKKVSAKFCESKYANYKCKQCDDKNLCNGIGRSCLATVQKSGNAFDSVLEGYELEGETKKMCNVEMPTCLTEYCKSGGYLHVWKGCAHEDYCGSKEQLKRVDMFCAGAQNSYQCKLCADKDECNLKAGKCWNTAVKPNETMSKFVFAKMENSTVGKPDYVCAPDKPVCVTEICHLNNRSGVLIRKGCAPVDYCENDAEIVNSNKEYCESQNATYTLPCKTCHGTDNCNGNAEKKQARTCLTTGANFTNNTSSDPKSTKCKENQSICSLETCRLINGKVEIRQGCTFKGYCNGVVSAGEKAKCESRQGTYLCKDCEEDNCNSIRKCWKKREDDDKKNFGFIASQTEYGTAEDTELCPLDKSVCVTQVCRPKPIQYLAVGVYAINYNCSPKIGSFLLPRFNGVILNGNDPGKKIKECNLVNKYTLITDKSQERKPVKITVDTTDLAKCRYRINSDVKKSGNESGAWENC